MKKNSYIILALSVWITACIPNTPAGGGIPPGDTGHNLSLIAFGSCSNQALNMGIFKSIREKKPDLYIAMGDNIYSDNIINTMDFSGWLNANYQILANNVYWKQLRDSIPMVATWDDHDYGLNNSGAEFPYKEQSKNVFLTFWHEPAVSERRNHPGVYTSYYYGDDEHRIQVILLDARTFLDVISPEPISPTTDTTKTILGAEQWAWLQSELLKPAKIRIICSSIQFGPQNNGWEGWFNYPHEQQHLYNLLKQTHAEGAFIISGDVHYSEISLRTEPGLYPIYDFTSSGLTHKEFSLAANSYRVGSGFADLNFAMIRIDWNANPVTISFETYNKPGTLVRQLVINLDDLKF